ncbi:MAG: response regulator [Bdellovibrionales bacterium]|nr:response regulator [Bdellovibrionales bacterium]
MKKSQINILVVDDDVSFRHAMIEAIQKFGYRVTTSARADEALNLVKIKHFHAAIIDCMLPKMNGVELAQEIRKTSFSQSPIILTSGIFKDKTFMTESLEKTQAVHFLAKPFHLTELKNTFDEQFKESLSRENVSLHVLVTKSFTSQRERIKVIEGLEKIKGFDLPFVICVLLEAKSSGYLNIATETNKLFGVTVQQGKITAVDGNDSEKNLIELLKSKGHLTSEEVQQVMKAPPKGDLLTYFVEQQFISPHLITSLRKEQILSDLNSLFNNESIKINFVAGRTKPSALNMSLEELTPLFHDVIEKNVPAHHIQSFYNEWLENPILTNSELTESSAIFQMSLFKKLPDLHHFLNEHLVMDEICKRGSFEKNLFLKAIHLLSFLKLISFDDVKKSKQVFEYGERMQQLFQDIKILNPFQIFNYFGASKEGKEQEVERIFKDFAKANHPDLLDKTTSEETKKIVTQVYSIVSQAYDVLINEDKRTKLINEIQQKDAKAQIQAESLAEEATLKLRNGKTVDALSLAKKAFNLNQSKNIKITYAWATLKSTTDSQTLTEINTLLETIPHEERRTANYHFVQGLLKKALGDPKGALIQFDKAIALDPNALEVRREKTLISSSNQKLDLFKSDLSELMGGLFKRNR